MKSKYNYEKYSRMTLKQLREHIESKPIEKLTLEDVFLYEAITKPIKIVKLVGGKK